MERNGCLSTPGSYPSWERVKARLEWLVADPSMVTAITAEALVIWTTKDPSGPVGEGRRIAGLIPNGRLAIIENAGHWPQYEQAEEFNRVHLDFLLGR